MHKRSVIATITVGSAIPFLLDAAVPAASPADLARELLRNRIEAAGTPPKIRIAQELIHASLSLPEFYERRGYHLAWSGDRGPRPLASELVEYISGANRDGLRPSGYRFLTMKTRLDAFQRGRSARASSDPQALVDLDLLLTDAFLILASHLLSGWVNPVTIDSEWFVRRKEADLALVLEQALKSGRLEQVLEGLLPRQRGYSLCRDALARYNKLAETGGWPVIPEGPTFGWR